MIRKIRQAAVVGSGVMGGGIAALLAGAGIKTIDDLAQMEQETLYRQQEISEQLVNRAIKEEWIGQARKLAL